MSSPKRELPLAREPEPSPPPKPCDRAEVAYAREPPPPTPPPKEKKKRKKRAPKKRPPIPMDGYGVNEARGSNASSDLRCQEVIHRAPSGEIFPDPLPGAWHLNKGSEVLQPGGKATTFRTELEPEDVKLVNELGRLTPDQLAEYVKVLQSNAFSLGVEEAKQFSKAKVLQIFKRRSDL